MGDEERTGKGGKKRGGRGDSTSSSLPLSSSSDLNLRSTPRLLGHPSSLTSLFPLPTSHIYYIQPQSDLGSPMTDLHSSSSSYLPPPSQPPTQPPSQAQAQFGKVINHLLAKAASDQLLISDFEETQHRLEQQIAELERATCQSNQIAGGTTGSAGMDGEHNFTATVKKQPARKVRLCLTQRRAYLVVSQPPNFSAPSAVADTPSLAAPHAPSSHQPDPSSQQTRRPPRPPRLQPSRAGRDRGRPFPDLARVPLEVVDQEGVALGLAVVAQVAVEVAHALGGGRQEGQGAVPWAGREDEESLA